MFRTQSVCFIIFLASFSLMAQTPDEMQAVHPNEVSRPLTVTPSSSFSTNSPFVEPSATTKFAVPDAPPRPKIVEITVTPGTLREGAHYDNAVRTTVTLSRAVESKYVCHVISSDKSKVVCGDIDFAAGEKEKDGELEIRWKNVDHDCRIKIKAFDDVDPDVVLSCSLYLKLSAH